jgi:hypothetical protein
MTTVAMMACKWNGFPKSGWQVRWEGLRPLLGETVSEVTVTSDTLGRLDASADKGPPRRPQGAESW